MTAKTPHTPNPKSTAKSTAAPAARSGRTAARSTKATVKPGSLILVNFVDQQLEGWTFPRSHWPLHITLVPWFRVDDEEAVVRSLERVGHETWPLTLVVGARDMFGDKRGVPVNVIANQAEVKALHIILMHTLDKADISFHEDRFTGQQYIAHITRYEREHRHSNEGEEVVLRDFHLVRLVDNKTCRVEQRIELRTHF